MPVYEYECPACGEFEVEQRITEEVLEFCNALACGEPVKRLIPERTGFALKGGGWFGSGGY